MRNFPKDELQRRVNEVLFYIWDPIGVSPEPCARAEYEMYVPMVLKLVEHHDETEPISSYLVEIIKNRMELTPNKERCDKVAELLISHKQAIKDGFA